MQYFLNIPEEVKTFKRVIDQFFNECAKFFDKTERNFEVDKFIFQIVAILQVLCF